MNELDILLNHAAIKMAAIFHWAFPAAWVGLGLFAFVKGRRLSGACFLLAGILTVLFSILFAEGSWFTRDWETDAPLNVSFSYKQLGFLLANLLLPASNISLLAGAYLLVKNRG